MTILITGGTGLIGSLLTTKLIELGHSVHILSRKKQKIKGAKVFEWNYKNGFIEKGAFEDVDTLVHLAGAGIADERWTDARKKEIIDSRVQSLAFISENIKGADLKAIIGGSAIGFYGADTKDNLQTIESPAGNDFLAECTQKWEDAEVAFAKKHKLRKVIIRTGVVLSNNGGALPKLIAPIKLNAGAALGSGNQWISWIHEDDLVQMFSDSISNSNISGTINGVAENPVTNQDFNQIASKVLDKNFFLPNVPAFVLKLALGEMSAVVLGSSKVESNFSGKIKFNKLEEALKDLLV